MTELQQLHIISDQLMVLTLIVAVMGAVLLLIYALKK